MKAPRHTPSCAPLGPRYPVLLLIAGPSRALFGPARLARALNAEYRYRYGRQRDHASIAVLDQVEELRFESRGLTEFAQAMPEQYKVPSQAVAAYRSFYLAEKRAFARWTRRAPPDWWTRDAA